MPQARIEAYWGYLFIAAPVIGFLVFGFFPMIVSMYLTFTRYNLFTPPVWNDFGNWTRLFTNDPRTWQSIINTLMLMLNLPISLLIAMVLAIALNQRIPGRGIFRTIYYLPVILPIAATSYLWLWIYNPEFGLLNNGIRGAAGFLNVAFGLPMPDTRINWLRDTDTARFALMLMGTWGGLGFQMVIYLAGLQGVPRQLYEAASIDGAGWWAKFRNITWPALTPVTFFLLITGMFGAFMNFAQPLLMTQGGPYNTTTTIVMSIVRNAFGQPPNMGYAATQSWALGAIILLITAINFALARRWVFYE
jgi:multiple sugar transport system permease protein